MSGPSPTFRRVHSNLILGPTSLSGQSSTGDLSEAQHCSLRHHL